MGTIQFPGCSLDIANIDRSELDRSLRKRANEIPIGGSMVRFVNVSFPYDHHISTQGLDKFLEMADLCMTTVLASIGATVIPHEWVLIPVESVDGQLARIGLKGFDLGAKVEVASGAPIKPATTPTYRDLHRTLKNASEAFFNEYGFHIIDIQAPSQCLANITDSSLPLTEITLVDIEPRVNSYVR